MKRNGISGPRSTGERPEAGATVPYNRLQAKPIPGERCRFCGDSAVPVVKTPCCQQWICCDTAFVSIRGGGRCQVEHERFSSCHSHYLDGHPGPWQTCQSCREFWPPAEYKAYAENPINGPRYCRGNFYEGHIPGKKP